MKFSSKPVTEHAEVPLADDGRFEALVAQWQERGPNAVAPSHTNNRCYLLSIHDTNDPYVQLAQLRELEGLVEAQGDTIVGTEQYFLRKKEPRTFIGSGIAERVAAAARQLGATMLVVDAELSPSQTRNLEDLTGLPICDREAVILNVFRRHASTKRARLQIEIAQLEYLRPRIRGIGLNMDQQMGGSNKARGPGETASELLARRIDTRITDLRRGLAQLKRADTAQRKHRESATRVALVGYTNAGKTSLMNALTHAELSARDRPFETLDTTSRSLTRHGGDVLVSDTVGFIRRLPERLLASFESTLAEVVEASLLLVVVDVSDPEARTHLTTTLLMLEKLGAGDLPRLLVFNKCDKVSGPESIVAELAQGNAHAVVSAHDVQSVDQLRQEIVERARAEHVVQELFVPYRYGALTKQIYTHCRVLSCDAEELGTRFTVQGARHHIHALHRALMEVQA
jgi:GTP-binding protein HflX